MKKGKGNVDKIKTERLILREVAYRDGFEIKREFDFELTLYMTPAPAKKLFEEFSVIRRMRKQWNKGSDRVYAITLRTTGEFLGLCGLHGLDRTAPEFGIWVKKSAHGNGFGREAVSALAETAARLGFRTAEYPVDRRNIPSKKIPLSMGGTLENFETNVSHTGRPIEIETYRIDLKRFLEK